MWLRNLKLAWALLSLAVVSSNASAQGIDQKINQLVVPISQWLSDVIFYQVELFNTSITLVVVWLIAGGVFFTVYLNFINISGFKHAIKLVKGDFAKPIKEKGELSHFQALATAVSGTVAADNDPRPASQIVA